MTLALFLQISPNNSVECCNLITPPGCQHRHWAGSEVEAQTWWGLAGLRPDSMPRPRSLRGIAASSRRYCSCPCHRGASPGQWPEGRWRSQTSAASHQYEPRNSAGVQCEVLIKIEVMELLVRVPEDTAVHCWAGGWRRHRSWLWADLMDRKLVLDPGALTKPLNNRDKVWVTNISMEP